MFCEFDASSDTIIAVGRDAYNNNDVDGRVFDLVDQLGCNVKNIDVHGFSASGYTASQVAVNCAEKGYSTSLYETDPHVHENSFKANFERNNISSELSRLGVPVSLNITSSNVYKSRENLLYDMYARDGADVRLLNCSESFGHSPGYSNFLSACYGGKDSSYDVFTGASSDELVKIDAGIMSRSGTLLFNYDIKDILKIGPISLDETSFDKYTYLKSLDTYTVTNLSSSTISSNSDYVVKFSNSIFSSIKSDSLLDATLLNIPQGCGPLADAINACLNLYYDSVGSLLNNLAQEVNSIMSIDNTLQNIDTSLSNEIEENLTFLSSIKVDVDNINNVELNNELTKIDDVYLYVSNNEQIMQENDNLTKLSSIDNKIKKNNHSGNTSNLIMTEDGAKYVSNVKNTTNASLISDTINGEKRELIYDKGTYNVVFETVNNDVTSMKYQYSFDNSEIASSTFEIFSKLKENDSVENVVLIGNKIEIIFNNKLFENITINKLLEQNFII